MHSMQFYATSALLYDATDSLMRGNVLVDLHVLLCNLPKSYLKIVSYFSR